MWTNVPMICRRIWTWGGEGTVPGPLKTCWHDSYSLCNNIFLGTFFFVVQVSLCFCFLILLVLILLFLLSLPLTYPTLFSLPDPINFISIFINKQMILYKYYNRDGDLFRTINIRTLLRQGESKPWAIRIQGVKIIDAY